MDQKQQPKKKLASVIESYYDIPTVASWLIKGYERIKSCFSDVEKHPVFKHEGISCRFHVISKAEYGDL